MSRIAILAAALMLTVPLMTLLPAAEAHQGQHPERISVKKTVLGADTYQFSIRYDRTQGDHFNIAPGSFVRVEGLYIGPNGSGQPRQEAGAIGGIVRYQDNKNCFDVNGNDPCFVSKMGISRQDTTDARVHTEGPIGFTFENDPNAWAWGSATGRIEWSGSDRFDIPANADQVTIRIFVSVPRAVALNIDVHIHSPQDISIREAVTHDGGFMTVGEEFAPERHVDSYPAQYMASGQDTVTLADDTKRIYAAFGPAWTGETQVGAGNTVVAGQHNTAGRSELFFHHPNGNTRGGSYYALLGGGELTVAGQNQLGDYVFEVQNHVGAGPEDVYLVGWKGETV